MKQIEKEKFISLVDRITSLKEEVKELREEVKEAIEIVAEEYTIEPKVLKKSINEYLKYQKDKNEYVASEMEVDTILKNVINFNE